MLIGPPDQVGHLVINVFLLPYSVRFSCKWTRQLAGTIHMLLATKRARVVEGYLCIQDFIAGMVGGNALIIDYLEIQTFKYLVLIRADKYKFHFPYLCYHEYFT